MKLLIQRELRLHLKGFLICTAICSALSLYLIALIPSMGASLQEIMDLKFPEKLQAAFGMKGLDFAQPMHAYSIMFSYLYLTYGIYAASLFAGIVAKEFTEKTAEYLFSLPAKRIHLLLAKLGVATSYLTAAILVTYLVAVIGFGTLIDDEVDPMPLLFMAIAYWLGAMFLGFASFLLSAFYVKSRLAVGLVMGAYLLQVLTSQPEGGLDFLKHFSPFDWFKGSEIVQENGLSWIYCTIALIGITAFAILGLRRFLNKDVLV